MYIYVLEYKYSVFFILGIFILGRGGYYNAQPTKSYFGLLLIWQRHFLGMASMRNLSSFTTSTSLIPRSKIQISKIASYCFSYLYNIVYIKIIPVQRNINFSFYFSQRCLWTVPRPNKIFKYLHRGKPRFRHRLFAVGTFAKTTSKCCRVTPGI